MKKVVGIILFSVSLVAQAAVGVSLGHDEWADDGFPTIRKGQQVSVFTCTGKMSGSEAGACALEKCFKKFKITDKTIVKKGSSDIYGGKCTIDGWSSRRGHSLIMVGPKGDNRFIMSKALGDITREIAYGYLQKNEFPVDRGTMVLDYFDKDGN